MLSATLNRVAGVTCPSRLPKVRKKVMTFAPSTMAVIRLTALVLIQTINATPSAKHSPASRAGTSSDISERV
ncbi:hypothetical protein D3C76_1371190 [compost metagenome]